MLRSLVGSEMCIRDRSTTCNSVTLPSSKIPYSINSSHSINTASNSSHSTQLSSNTATSTTSESYSLPISKYDIGCYFSKASQLSDSEMYDLIKNVYCPDHNFVFPKIKFSIV